MKTNEFRVIGEFCHDGITHSPGEVAPSALTRAEIEDLRAAGKILRRGETRDAAADALLVGDDLLVLTRLRAERPGREVLRRLLETARRVPRSPLLVEALALATAEPWPAGQPCP